ncbi:MAG TPA: hypothetical protein VF043_02000 [Ktedonobacteraceae bacterium]
MSSTSLIRWSGVALLLAGALIAVPILFHPSYADPQALMRPAWVPIHTALTISAILALFGLVGLYTRLRERSGWFGLIGFVLIFTGTALFVAGLSIEAFVLPALASSAAGQTLLDPAGPLFGGPLNVVLLLTSGIFSLGCLLFCVAILRSEITLHWMGLLLLGGILLAFWPPLPDLVGIIGGVLLGLGFIWFGYILLARSGERVVQAQATA